MIGVVTGSLSIARRQRAERPPIEITHPEHAREMGPFCRSARRSKRFSPFVTRRLVAVEPARAGAAMAGASHGDQAPEAVAPCSFEGVKKISRGEREVVKDPRSSLPIVMFTGSRETPSAAGSINRRQPAIALLAGVGVGSARRTRDDGAPLCRGRAAVDNGKAQGRFFQPVRGASWTKPRIISVF